jgi:uncharacterized protein YdbL (DUF1318 family)
MKRFAIVVAVAVLMLCPSSFGSAARADDSLDLLRKSGAVGERYDGLLSLRSQGDSAARAVVDQVNAKRSAIYEAQAKNEGADVKEVAKVYALEISTKAPAGTWFLGEDGKWVQKK